MPGPDQKVREQRRQGVTTGGRVGKRRQPGWRAWVVRGLVFGSTGMVLALASVFWAWTNPSQLRQTVLAALAEEMPGSIPSLEGASMRLLGGITLVGLRVARRDDLDKSDFFYVPRAVLFHDKEQLIDGKLAIRKVELFEPRLRLIRTRSGDWNLEGLTPGAADSSNPIPTLVVEGGVLQVEDRTTGTAGPPIGHLLEIRQVEMLAMNDPPGMFRLEARGVSDLLGPVTMLLEQERSSKAWAARIELSALTLDATALRAAASLLQIPDLGTLEVRGRGKVVLELAGSSQRSMSHQATFEFQGLQVRGGPFPLALKDGQLKGRWADGKIPLMTLSGQVGEGELKVRLDDLDLKPTSGWPSPDTLGGTWRASLSGMPVDGDLLRMLPTPCPAIWELLNPQGVVDLAYLRQPKSGAPGIGTHRVEIRPRAGNIRPRHFPYQLNDVDGLVAVGLEKGTRPHVSVDLHGLAGPDPWTAKGDLRHEEGGWGVDLHVLAGDLALDNTLLEALPPHYRDLARQFQPTAGRVNVDVRILAEAGTPGFSTEAVIGVSEAVVRYEHFPLPFEKVRGVIEVKPDHWVCRDFIGERGGGEIRMAGRSWPGRPAAPPRVPGPVPASGILPRGSALRAEVDLGKMAPIPGLFRIVLRGEKLPVDDEFRAALAPPGVPERNMLLEAAKVLGLSERLSFDADVVQKLVPTPELEVEVALRQATMTPRLFPCRIEDISATCRYTPDKIMVRDMRLRHGKSQVALREGNIFLRPAGGYRARVEGVRADPLILEPTLLAAMPAAARRMLQSVELRDPVILAGNVTMDSAGEGAGAWPQIDWDGKLQMAGTRLVAGIEARDLDGEVVCEGRFNGHGVENAHGQIALDQGSVFGQKFGPLRTRFEMRPDSPEVLRLRDIQGTLFGGVLGGQGRVHLAARPRFEFDLRASQVDLAQAASHNGIPGGLQGLAFAWLHLAGEAGDLGSFKGEGRLDIPRGRLYELPVFLDLMKAGGLRVPDKTAFEEARAEVVIEGHEVQVKRLDLLGNAFSLRGKGKVQMETQDTQLDFHVDLARLNQILPPLVSELPKVVSDQLLAIEVRGKPGQLRFQKYFLPPVSGPLRKMMGPSAD